MDILRVYIIADKVDERFGSQLRLLHHFRLPAATSYWEWRRREVCCNLNFVCRAFRVGRFASGLLSCLVWVNCIDTRVSIPSFSGFSLLLSALAGVHKLVIFAGENSKLNSCTNWSFCILESKQHHVCSRFHCFRFLYLCFAVNALLLISAIKNLQLTSESARVRISEWIYSWPFFQRHDLEIL